MTKTNTQSKLQANYEKACNDYVEALLKQWELDGRNGWWIADDIGGVYAYGDVVFLGIDDIRYCVDNNVTYETYMDYQDYNVWALDFGQNTLNLKSWCMGAPRIDDVTRERISALRFELDKLCRETKESF